MGILSALFDFFVRGELEKYHETELGSYLLAGKGVVGMPKLTVSEKFYRNLSKFPLTAELTRAVSVPVREFNINPDLGVGPGCPIVYTTKDAPAYILG